MAARDSKAATCFAQSDFKKSVDCCRTLQQTSTQDVPLMSSAGVSCPRQPEPQKTQDPSLVPDPAHQPPSPCQSLQSLFVLHLQFSWFTHEIPAGVVTVIGGDWETENESLFPRQNPKCP